MLNVLHIEDDEDIRALASMALSLDEEISLTQALDGNDGLKKAEVSAPDLILLDYMMPGLSGIDVYRKIRTELGLEDVPIAFVTARTTPDDEKCMIDLGAVAVLRKPFDPLSLPHFVREHANIRASD